VKATLAAVLVLASQVALAGPQPSASAPAPADSTAEVRAAVETFLHAFEALDWPAFRACFAEGATVFQPTPPHVLRTDSPESFERAWAAVFERIRRNSGRTAPPYMTLSPKDLRIQLLSEKSALVTFHLPQGETLGRRTVILERLDAGWKIVHLHASNLSRPAAPSTVSPGTATPAPPK
jgi:ketosteroid isomerase-like protein